MTDEEFKDNVIILLSSIDEKLESISQDTSSLESDVSSILVELQCPVKGVQRAKKKS